MDNVNPLNLIDELLVLAKDVEKVLKLLGILHANDTHPVVQHLQDEIAANNAEANPTVPEVN